LGINESSVQYLNKLLGERPEVLITTHYNPDGDAIGSSLALYHLLKSLEIPVRVLIPNELPGFLKWLPGAAEAVDYSENPEIAGALITRADLIFCMDYNSLSRVKLFTDELRASQTPRILIDHHLDPDDSFNLIFSDISVSSTSELLYQVMEKAGHSGQLTPEMAECFFVGIMTDTGSYSYACNRPETFEITAKLIRCGLNVERVHRMVYDTYSESRMRLLGHCLGPRLKVISEFATAYIWLSREDLDEFSYQQGDTEGVVNYALSIENVALAALFTQRDDRIRVSLRSKGDFPVSDMARTHFNGGGHRNAAGGDIFLSMEEALVWFESLLPGYSSEINRSLSSYR
jgi:bifunctional oligoribonuclease and PAP phosphatase NrnA